MLLLLPLFFLFEAFFRRSIEILVVFIVAICERGKMFTASRAAHIHLHTHRARKCKCECEQSRC